MVNKLYCNDLYISPFNKNLRDVVNPQPGQGILNKLYTGQILKSKKFEKYIILNIIILSIIYLNIFFLLSILHYHANF